MMQLWKTTHVAFDWRKQMSIKMKFVRLLVKKMSKGMFDSDEMDVARIRGILKKAYDGHKIENGVTMRLGEYENVEVATFTPNLCKHQHIVYYLHGGGLVTGDRLTAGPYASQLALEMGCKVVSCSYRLAPEDPYPAGVNDSYAVYKSLIEENPMSKISLIGESGGAYLALVVALKARDEKMKMPSALVLNSIVADLSGHIKRVDSPKETTVSVAGLKTLAQMYAGGQSTSTPYISPILADYKGLPPMRIIYDEDELLAADSIEVAKKAHMSKVSTEVEVYKGCFHAFTTTGKDTPESKRELILSSKFMLNSFYN